MRETVLQPQEGNAALTHAPTWATPEHMVPSAGSPTQRPQTVGSVCVKCPEGASPYREKMVARERGKWGEGAEGYGVSWGILKIFRN